MAHLFLASDRQVATLHHGATIAGQLVRDRLVTHRLAKQHTPVQRVDRADQQGED